MMNISILRDILVHVILVTLAMDISVYKTKMDWAVCNSQEQFKRQGGDEII